MAATGVYWLRDEFGTVLYIGSSLDPVHRFDGHRVDKRDWATSVRRIDIDWYETRAEAKAAEAAAIGALNPPYNKELITDTARRRRATAILLEVPERDIHDETLTLAEVCEQQRRAVAERDECIRAAHAAGLSLRAIASDVGLSHTQVANICR